MDSDRGSGELDPNVAIARTYQEVGRGISTWATLEMLIVQIAAKLIGTSEQTAGLIFYSVNGFHTWIAIIDRLFENENLNASRNLWAASTSRLKGLNDTRVRLAHQALYIDLYEDKDGAPRTALSGLRPAPFDGRSKQRRMNAFTTEEIIAFSKSVEEVYSSLSHVVGALASELSRAPA